MLSRTMLHALALLLLAASMAMAQVTPSVSTDPLGGSTFSTPAFTPPQTFTPTTTYASAGSRTPTVISGQTGPSPDSSAYAFTYNVPLSSVSNTPLDSLYSSLAANGFPTQYTSKFQPDTSNLQIVVDEADALHLKSFAVTFTALAIGFAFGAAIL